MVKLLQTLIRNCEVAVHQDANGFRVSAKGALGLVAVVVLAAILKLHS
jgi:hypothetical protein